MQEQNPRLKRVIAIILTIAFLGTLFGTCIAYFASDARRLVRQFGSERAHANLTDKTKDGPFELLSAAISGFEDTVSSMTPLKDEMNCLNAFFQRMIGKDLVIQGSQQLLFMDGNQIYGVTTQKTLADKAQNVITLRETCADSPFFFAFISPQFYEGGEPMPAGYDTIDTGDELADEVLGIISDAGIDALDSRKFFTDVDYTTAQMQLSGDQHWTTLAALTATPIYVEEIEKLTGVDLDESKIALDQFDTEVYPQFFSGQYAEQVGRINAGLDDIIIYTPKYETSFTRHAFSKDNEESFHEGDFSEAIICWDKMITESDDSPVSVVAYAAYGLQEAYEEIINQSDDCADMTILIYRDSYTAPIARFLSLMVKRVVMVDMRYYEGTASGVYAETNPDIVICSFSRQMFIRNDYSIVD